MIREEQKYGDLCMILLDPASLILFKPNFPRSMGLENLQPPAFVTRTVALKFLEVIRLSTGSLEQKRIVYRTRDNNERENEGDSNFDRHSFKEIVNFIFYPTEIIFLLQFFIRKFSFFFFFFHQIDQRDFKKKEEKFIQVKFLSSFLLLFGYSNKRIIIISFTSIYKFRYRI